MKNYPPIQEVPDLFSAIFFNDISKVKKVLQKHPELANQYNSYDGSVLHSAISKGNLEIVQILLEYGANVYTKDYNQENCIDYANKHANLNNHKLEITQIYELIMAYAEKDNLEQNIQKQLKKNNKNKL